MICDYYKPRITAENFTWTGIDFSSGCLQTATYVGWEACPALDASFIISYLGFGGVVYCIVGLILIFLGCKLLLYIMTFFSFLVGFSCLFALAYNFGIITDPSIPVTD